MADMITNARGPVAVDQGWSNGLCIDDAQTWII